MALARLKMSGPDAAAEAAGSGGAGGDGAVDVTDVAPTLTASKKEHPFFHYYGLLVHQVRHCGAAARRSASTAAKRRRGSRELNGCAS